jgi:predicted secreted protein
MTAFVGRDTLVEFAIAAEDASIGSLTYSTLGMVRDKSIKTDWDTADTTADDSPDFTKTALVTFKMVEFTGSGVTYSDSGFNQETFRAHVISPGAGTGNQPKVWLRITLPTTGVYEGPFIVTSWEDQSPYSDTLTWSLTAMSNGAVTYTP